MKPSEAIATLSALASEPGLTVYRLLVKRGPGGYTPSELSERLELAAPTLSFHLKECASKIDRQPAGRPKSLLQPEL